MKRLYWALLVYGSLIAIAFAVLEGKFRYAVLVLLVGLALKTLIADRSGRARK